jgi:hypothetical protein
MNLQLEGSEFQCSSFRRSKHSETSLKEPLHSLDVENFKSCKILLYKFPPRSVVPTHGSKPSPL